MAFWATACAQLYPESRKSNERRSSPRAGLLERGGSTGAETAERHGCEPRETLALLNPEKVMKKERRPKARGDTGGPFRVGVWTSAAIVPRGSEGLNTEKEAAGPRNRRSPLPAAEAGLDHPFCRTHSGCPVARVAHRRPAAPVGAAATVRFSGPPPKPGDDLDVFTL